MVGDGEAEALGDGLGDGEAPGQTQSVSLVQSGLTQRLFPPTVIHLKLVSH